MSPKHYYVRVGGHPFGVTAASARHALIVALADWTPEQFEQLAERTESRRITVSISVPTSSLAPGAREESK